MDRVMHLAINSGTDLALFNAWLTYINDKAGPTRRSSRPYVDKLLIEGKGGVHHIWPSITTRRRSMRCNWVPCRRCPMATARSGSWVKRARKALTPGVPLLRPAGENSLLLLEFVFLDFTP